MHAPQPGSIATAPARAKMSWPLLAAPLLHVAAPELDMKRTPGATRVPARGSQRTAASIYILTLAAVLRTRVGVSMAGAANPRSRRRSGSRGGDRRRERRDVERETESWAALGWARGRRRGGRPRRGIPAARREERRRVVGCDDPGERPASAAMFVSVARSSPTSRSRLARVLEDLRGPRPSRTGARGASMMSGRDGGRDARGTTDGGQHFHVRPEPRTRGLRRPDPERGAPTAPACSSCESGPRRSGRGTRNAPA